VIPVKIVNGDNTELVHTLDIACTGARLGGLRSQLRMGETVVLHRGSKNAKFRIIWIRQLNPKEIQAGVQALENPNRLFGSGVAETNSQIKAEMTFAKA